MKRRSAALLCLLALAFAWGFLSAQRQIFPFHLLRRMALGLGTLESRPLEVAAPSQSLETLLALPYVEATFDPRAESRGVTLHRPRLAYPGYNLYTSIGREGALLLDMEGQVVRRWSYAGDPWQHAELLPDGDVLALVKYRRLMRLDQDSQLLWTFEEGVHHDLWVGAGGDIWVLSRESRRVPAIHPTRRVLTDTVVHLSASGEVRERLSLLEAILDSSYAFLLPSAAHLPLAPGVELDLLHTNHVEVFDGRLAGHSPLFARGNLLVSLRNLNLVAILDPAGRILWGWGPNNVTSQHHPTLLDNGHLLLFDNGLTRSRVIELDPLSREVVWSYGPQEGFFSRTRGSNQRLPNGNTLITESDTGYAFEVTSAGEVVWEFANPDVNERGERSAIFRMRRFSAAELPFLAASTAGEKETKSAVR